MRGCGPIPMDFQVRTHCGGHSADGTFHKTCVEEYLEHTFAHERYKPSDGERPDLDYVPWHCPESIARATCPDGDDAPLLGSFTFVGHVIGPAIGRGSSLSLRSAVPDITALRNKHCLGAPVSNGLRARNHSSSKACGVRQRGTAAVIVRWHCTHATQRRHGHDSGGAVAAAWGARAIACIGPR